MTTKPVGITIPDDLDFAHLKMARDADGAVSFDWTPIERICSASGIDPSLFSDASEDNVSSLIVAWYRMHLAAGGARDPVQDDLIAEAELEDKHGGGLSHPPGRA